jgi:hypothetical protein
MASLPPQVRASVHRRLTVGSIGVLVLGLAGGCERSSPSLGPDAGTAAGKEAIEAGGPAASAPLRPGDDVVRPVYPVDVKPDAIAIKLCDALHALPEKTRSGCCAESPGFTIASECARVVSAALQSKAVSLDAVDVDKCVADLGQTYAGCDWVGSHKIVPPPSCEGILHGTIKEGASCRSSVECLDGLRCAGVGPTSVGRCESPGDEGASCGGSVDVLDRYTRQQKSELKHPACKGICDRHRCVPTPAVGAPCKASVSCGPGKACVNDKCAVARVQKRGDPCADGECDAGLYCIKGRCVGPQPAGAECSTEFECVGACLLSDGGTKGKCGKRCGAR